MTIKDFKGDRKVPMKSPLAAIEKRFVNALVDKFPAWIEGYHLTLMTISWSGGVVLFGYLAYLFQDYRFLWGSSLLVFLQWFTDCFDGALGRHRDFGIPKWGFYMDHLLDFVFMACVIMSYGFLVGPGTTNLVFLIGFIYLLFMVNSFLAFGATTEFKITYLGVGPTEVRLIIIIVNTIVILTNSNAVIRWFAPWVLVASFVACIYIVWKTSRKVWAVDMRDKIARKRAEK
ncbi:MAG: CDP-alcohol phosphatidyltransferase family protein [Candidatus Sumerlaeota bacterium]